MTLEMNVKKMIKWCWIKPYTLVIRKRRSIICCFFFIPIAMISFTIQWLNVRIFFTAFNLEQANSSLRTSLSNSQHQKISASYEILFFFLFARHCLEHLRFPKLNQTGKMEQSKKKNKSHKNPLGERNSAPYILSYLMAPKLMDSLRCENERNPFYNKDAFIQTFNWLCWQPP